MAAPRDYYADLELPSTAEIPEIKKQYRKLALKYHPDRNPGREQEVNAQFLIIQTAHDVLTDPQQKAKFDASRLRGGPGRAPAGSGVRGNPWATAADHFPPPPRRNAQTSRNTASGADRWNTRFSSGVPPTAKQQAAANSESRRNAAKAFESMKPKAQAKTQPSAAPPPTPPRTESARQRQQASFGAARKSGYQPRGPAHGDEPGSTSKNYAPRPDLPPRKQPQPTAEINAERANAARMPDPLSQFRDNSGADGRQRSPYMAHGGEKTNPFDSVPNQAASAGHDHQTSSPENSDAAAPGTSGHTQSSQAGDGRSHPMYETPYRDKVPPLLHRIHRDSLESIYGTSKSCQQASKDSLHSPQHSAPSGEDQSPSNLTPFERAQQTLLVQLIANAEVKSEKRRRSSTIPNQTYTKNIADTYFTSFIVPDDTGSLSSSPDRKSFAKSSVDDINTSFVNDDCRTAWQFNAGGEQNSNASQPAGQEGSSAEHDAQNVHGEKPQSSEGFNAQSWNFGPQTFDPPPRTNSSGSPSKATRTNSKKPKATKPSSGENGHNAILIDSSDEEAFTWRGRKSQGKTSATDTPQAMDIDSPPVTTEPESPQPNGARNIHVEPSRPEWRSGDFAGPEDKTAETNEPVNPNAAGSEDTEEFKASFADFRNVAPFATQTSGLKSFDDMKDNLPFESKASDEIPLEDKVPAPQPLVFPSPPQAPRPPLTMGVPNMTTNLPTWEKYVQEFEDYMRHWDAFSSQVTDHFAARKAQIANQRKEKGYGFLRSRGDTDCVEYFKGVHQDNDVRKRWNAACDVHEQCFREFMAAREKMK